MPKKSAEGKTELSVLVITVSLFFGIVGAGVGSGVFWKFFVDYKAFHEKERRLIENVGTILRYDEVLTMSCKMAAVTGKAEYYEERYHRVEPELGRTIRETMDLFPLSDTRGFVNKTGEANQRLVQAEKQAFALVREGQSAKAMAILNSEEYLNWRDRYKKGMVLVSRAIFREAEDLDRQFQKYQKGMIFGGILGLIFLFSWWGHSVLMAARLNRTVKALRASDKTRTMFIGKMSHEFRTPLNSVLGFSEVLRDETFGPLNEKQKSYVQNVLTSGEHLLLLVNEILDFSKNEFKETKLFLTLFSCKDFFREIFLAFKRQVSDQGLEMTLDVAGNVSQIFADERKIRRVLFSLISNAIQFTPRGGKVRVRVHRSEQELLFGVEDTGVGIAPQDQKNVFENFTPSESGGEKKSDGLGLGLAMARSLVELHGGKIWIESGGLGQGTTVKFTIPSRRV